MDIVHFALIGCGKIALRHIDAINASRDTKLVAVCDANGERAQTVASYAYVPFYTDYHQMLRDHPQINVINLMTPSGMHFKQCVDIITKYHKHLVIEKPMVLTNAHAQQLKSIADKHHVKLFPIYQHRFNKAVQRVKAAINNANELGKLRVGTIRVRWCRPQRYYDLSSWRGTWAMDGGALTNQGIHFIDLLRYLCGNVKKVNAKLATLGANIEVEDTATAILEFESGALGMIEIMTCARPDDFEASISCVCENGLALITGAATNELQTFSPDPTQTTEHSEVFPNTYGFGHNVVMQGIVDHLLRGQTPAITFEDGAQTIKLLHALYKSDEKNGWLNVQDAGDSIRLGVSF